MSEASKSKQTKSKKLKNENEIIEKLIDEIYKIKSAKTKIQVQK